MSSADIVTAQLRYAQWKQALLIALTPPSVGAAAKLEQPCNLRYVLQLGRHLTTLQLTVPARLDEKEEVDDFYSALASSPLPSLRHVRLAHLVLNRQPDVRWPLRLLTVMPAFVTSYSQQLLSLELSRISKDDIFTDAPSSTAEAMTTALLSCTSLRRLRIADWWLSTTVHAASSPALPCLQSLEMDVMKGLDQPTLAVLLDEAPQLEELVFWSSPLPYDVLVWVAERCHRLRSLLMVGNQMDKPFIGYPAAMSVERFIRHQLRQRPALLLLLNTAFFRVPPPPSAATPCTDRSSSLNSHPSSSTTPRPYAIFGSLSLSTIDRCWPRCARWLSSVGW